MSGTWRRWAGSSASCPGQPHLFLVGCISISALPPFNGFVSEWLTYQAFLLSPALPSPLLNLLIPLGAALLALTSALAAACFVKAFGVTFLGHQRGHHHGRVHEVRWSMRIGMLLAALTCLGLGVLPTVVIKWMDPIAEELVGGTIAASASGFGWMWLTPIAAERASYSAPIAFLGILCRRGRDLSAAPCTSRSHPPRAALGLRF